MFKYLKGITLGNFSELVQYNDALLESHLSKLAKEIKSDVLFIAGLDNSLESAHALITLSQRKRVDNFDYQLQGSPCQEVLDREMCAISDSAYKVFSNDIELVNMKVEGYLGVPITDSSGKPLGLLVALFFNPKDNIASFHYAFSLFATHITSIVETTFEKLKSQAQTSLLNEVEEISNTGAWEYHIDGGGLYWSDEVYLLYGLPIGTNVTAEEAISYYAAESQDIINTVFTRALDTGEPYSVELKFRDTRGQIKWVRTTGKVGKDKMGNIERLYGAIEDISREYRFLSEARYESTRLQRVLDNLNDAVVTIDGEGIIQHTNRIAAKIFGYGENELHGQPVSVLMPEPYASKHHEYMAHYAQTGEAKIIGFGRQLPGLKKSGAVFQMELSLTKAEYDDEVEYIGIIRDISERIQAQDAIYNLAYTDAISGLKNKVWFEKECKDLLIRARLQSHFLYAAIIDIDKMAQVNLRYGFKAGNEVIKQIGTQLMKHIPRGVNLYKNGADSFIVLNLSTKPKRDSEDFNHVALENAILQPDTFKVTVNGEALQLSASLGSCVCEADYHTFESVLDTLEHAMENAKKVAPSGRYFVDEAGMQAYERAKKIRDHLEYITQTDELSLALQPQLDANENLIASEALIRWHSKELGFISPADFIPIAEESDAIVRIGDWVIEKVCETLGKLNQQSVKTQIAINVSAKQIVAPDFLSKLTAKTDRYGVNHGQIMLELTETTLVSDIELVKHVMLDLRNLGFTFSIDDFGTGYSSLSYLKELPISELKIDKYFVDDILSEDNPSAGNIVNLIIDMGKALGVNTVAEGVETGEQVAFLRARNCDLYQGYFYSKPLPIEEWKVYLSNKISACESV